MDEEFTNNQRIYNVSSLILPKDKVLFEEEEQMPYLNQAKPIHTNTLPNTFPQVLQNNSFTSIYANCQESKERYTTKRSSVSSTDSGYGPEDTYDICAGSPNEIPFQLIHNSNTCLSMPSSALLPTLMSSTLQRKDRLKQKPGPKPNKPQSQSSIRRQEMEERKQILSHENKRLIRICEGLNRAVYRLRFRCQGLAIPQWVQNKYPAIREINHFTDSVLPTFGQSFTLPNPNNSVSTVCAQQTKPAEVSSDGLLNNDNYPHQSSEYPNQYSQHLMACSQPCNQFFIIPSNSDMFGAIPQPVLPNPLLSHSYSGNFIGSSRADSNIPRASEVSSSAVRRFLEEQELSMLTNINHELISKINELRSNVLWLRTVLKNKPIPQWVLDRHIWIQNKHPVMHQNKVHYRPDSNNTNYGNNNNYQGFYEN